MRTAPGTSRCGLRASVRAQRHNAAHAIGVYAAVLCVYDAQEGVCSTRSARARRRLHKTRMQRQRRVAGWGGGRQVCGGAVCRA